MLDLNFLTVEVRIRADGKVVWVSTEGGCQLRISGIESLALHDDRTRFDNLDLDDRD